MITFYKLKTGIINLNNLKPKSKNSGDLKNKQSTFNLCNKCSNSHIYKQLS